MPIHGDPEGERMTTSTEPTNDSPPEWAPCDAGTLGGLSQRLRADHSRGVQKRLAGGVLTVAAAAVLALAVWPSGTLNEGVAPGFGNPSSLVAKIDCNRCLELMPGYYDRLVSAETNAAADLSADQATAVAAHLEVCPRCREHFEEAYPGTLAAAAGLGLLGFATRRFRHG